MFPSRFPGFSLGVTWGRGSNAEGEGDRDEYGLGTAAGGRDAGGESRAATELISARLPHRRDISPSVHRCPAGWGARQPPNPAPSIHPSLAAAGCSLAPHLSWGRRRAPRCPSLLLCAGTRAGAACPHRCRTLGARQPRPHRSSQHPQRQCHRLRVRGGGLGQLGEDSETLRSLTASPCGAGVPMACAITS